MKVEGRQRCLSKPQLEMGPVKSDGIPLTCLYLFIYFYSFSSRNSSGGIATGYRLDGRGSIPDRGKIFLFSTAFRPPLRPTQPPIQWVPGANFTWIKRPRREADHSPPSSKEVKNGGAMPPLPPYVFLE
jgi:hypothetical protein